MSKHLVTGKEGEAAAAGFLRSKGYSIVALNWKSPTTRRELDIIARDGDVVVFVEVKTRKGIAYGFPEASVTPAKQEHIADAAEEFLVINRMDPEIRFDIVSIVHKEGEEPEFYHIRDAFAPGIG